MKFGVREICDVVLKTKAIQQVGNKVFYKNEPVLYFDSLKTSSMEGAATTVYAQGGKGNSRLIAWEGERTVTFTMEDALLSPAGFSILSGAGLVNASDEKKIKTHITERTADIDFVAEGEEFYDYGSFLVMFEDDKSTSTGWDNPHYPLKNIYYGYQTLPGSQASKYRVSEPICHICEDEDEEYNGKYMWFPKETTVFSLANAEEYWGPCHDPESPGVAADNIIFIYLKERPLSKDLANGIELDSFNKLDLELAAPIYIMRVVNDEVVTEPFYADEDDYSIQIVADENSPHYGEYRIALKVTDDLDKGFLIEDNGEYVLDDDVVVLIDYYTEKSTGYEINITPDKFGGNYYLEASTLFRDTDGVDLPALFIIPNCKIQSNFTFTMASSGDPSTFTFTMDAFPDYTRFDKKKKVLTSIQILDVTSEDALRERTANPWSAEEDASDATREKTWTGFEPAND